MKTRPLVYGALAFLGGLAGDLLFHHFREAEAAPQDRSPYAMVGQLGRVLAVIENDYVDPVDRTRLVEGAIKGMVNELDPHSIYLPPVENQAEAEQLQGQFGGIGIEVDIRGSVVIVVDAMENSPAERAGIQTGDEIVAVDNQEVVAGVEKMIRKIRGPANTKVKLAIQRKGQKDLITLELTREIIKVASVTSKMLDGGIAYLKVKQFGEHTHDEFLENIATLRRQGSINGCVLDLRGNPGGLVDQATEIADEIMNDGVVFTARHRGQTTDEVRAHSGGALANVPFVALVNEGSASAAELVAGALQDNHRAKIVGANTFGKGSVQTIMELPNGAGMKLTTARYYTPSGRTVQSEGIHPDVLVDLSKGPLPPFREKNYENALSAEGTPPHDAGVVLVAPGDAGVDESPSVKKMPIDPRKGNDFTLRVGYELLVPKK